MKPIFKLILINLITFLFFFTNISLSEDQELGEILEIIQKDLRTLERAVYSQSFSENSESNTSQKASTKESEQALTKHLLKLNEIEVQFQNNLTNPSVVFMFDDVSAGDINTTPIMAWADGFGQYINTLDVVTKNSDLPNRYFLHPNYPNPFNPITTLQYDLVNDEFVNITIYDMLGNVINNLVQDN